MTFCGPAIRQVVFRTLCFRNKLIAGAAIYHTILSFIRPCDPSGRFSDAMLSQQTDRRRRHYIPHYIPFTYIFQRGFDGRIRWTDSMDGFDGRLRWTYSMDGFDRGIR